MIHLFAFLLIFIILLIAFFYWQHRYFHPDSLREIDKRERKLLKQAAREVNPPSTKVEGFQYHMMNMWKLL